MTEIESGEELVAIIFFHQGMASNNDSEDYITFSGGLKWVVHFFFESFFAVSVLASTFFSSVPFCNKYKIITPRVNTNALQNTL